MTSSGNPTEIFLSNVLVVDSKSPHNGKKVDILVRDGVIRKIGKGLKEPFGATVMDGKNLNVSPGFADLHTNVQDPGFEHKEDIDSALEAAAAGGFTGILSVSSTLPCVDNKSAVEYQLRKSRGKLTELWVSGALSKNREGKELAEMFDMHSAGAVAFCDFKSEIPDSQLLKLALLYTKSFDGLVMLHPGEYYLDNGGQVNEGKSSTESGLTGIPAVAEVVGIQRALRLAEYTDQAIHITSVSTAEGVDLIRRARKSGTKVSCGVSVANLFFNDESISTFDTNFKVKPPLREEKTRKALIDALRDGVIDVVISDHWPQNTESKDCEFDLAEFGMNTLEYTFAMLRNATFDKIELAQLISILSSNPRKILKMNCPVIAEGELANMTIYQPDLIWKYDVRHSSSKSRNITLPSQLTGKVKGVINNGKARVNP